MEGAFYEAELVALAVGMEMLASWGMWCDGMGWSPVPQLLFDENDRAPVKYYMDKLRST